MGLPPWETSDSQLFTLITGANSGLGYAIACRLIDEFMTSPLTPPNKHLVLILATRSPMKTRFTISKLRAHLRILVDLSEHAKKLRAIAKTEGREYLWEEAVQRVHFLGVEVDLCDLKSVYALADKLVNGTVGSPDATTMDGAKLPHGSPGTSTYSDNIKQDRWALSNEPGSTGRLRSWGWGLNGIRLPRIDVIVLSAGLGAWTGLNWLQAVWDVLTDTIEAVTWPRYKLANVGGTARLQSSYSVNAPKDGDKQPLLSEQSKSTEMPLGEVFCANVFGHYILVHELMPLLSRSASATSNSGGKIVWVSSVEAESGKIDIEDIQGLKSLHPYEDGKRLIDLMALTADLPSTKRAVAPYFDPSKTVTGCKAKQELAQNEESHLLKPTVYLTHPGIFASEILPLPAIFVFIYKLVFVFARWIGSPWHPTEPYKAAVAPTWIALTDNDVLQDMEEGGKKKAKWGSATNSNGDERVMKTEVAGWGWQGVVEELSAENKIGRRRGAINATKESREDFEILGGKCWAEMEDLRKTWEAILEVKDT